MSAQFKDKIVLITGAGTGIGKLMAERFAAMGSTVLLSARRLDVVDAVAADIRAKGGKAHAYRLDVAEITSFPDFQAQVLRDHGGIDVLINNAGVVHGGAFESVPLSQHLETLQINSHGLIALTHAFMSTLLQRQQAHIVNIASASGFIGLPFGSTYAASKWAVVGFSDSLRLELKVRGHRNVSVTTVCPSYIATGMFDGVKAPLFSPILTPDKLVNGVIKGMTRQRAFVMAPYMVNWIDFGKGVMPRLLWDWFARVIGISTSMSTWHGK